MTVTVESPFPAHAVPRIWGWMEEFRGRVADDFAPQTLGEFVEQWEAAVRGGERITWGVWRDGELGGVIVVDRQSLMVAITHCIFAKRFWGHDTTATALRLAYREAFGLYGKLSSAVFADNRQLLHLARVLGAQKEGVLRKHTLRHGKPVDLVLVGLLKEEFDGAEYCDGGAGRGLGEPGIGTDGPATAVEQSIGQ